MNERQRDAAIAAAVVGGIVLLWLLGGLLWRLATSFTALYVIALVAFIYIARDDLRSLRKATVGYIRNYPTMTDLVQAVGGEIGEKLQQLNELRNLDFDNLPENLNRLLTNGADDFESFRPEELRIVAAARHLLMREHDREHSAYLSPSFTLGGAALIVAGIPLMTHLWWGDIWTTVSALFFAVGWIYAGHRLGQYSIPDQHAGVLTFLGRRISLPLYLDEGGHALPFLLFSMEGPVSRKIFRVFIPRSTYQTRAGKGEDSIQIRVGDDNSHACTLTCEVANPRDLLNIEGETPAERDAQRDRLLRDAADQHLLTSISGRYTSDFFGKKETEEGNPETEESEAVDFDTHVQTIAQEIEDQVDGYGARLGINVTTAKIGHLMQSEDVLSGNELIAIAERLQDEAGDKGEPISWKDALFLAQIQMEKRRASVEDKTYEVGERFQGALGSLLGG